MASMTSTLRGGEDVAASTLSPKRSLSLTNADSSAFSGWKRPWMSQVNFKFWFLEKSTYLDILFIWLYLINIYLLQSTVRERLVTLLNTCGQRVGLPKSPSVSLIFLYILKCMNCKKVCFCFKKKKF